ncbi:Gfo/Idh/MocA family protein [Qingshengfaniella alkalisoli]|uniref:Gfo/Idh/MocA family oxidoreductase n=1 Tax=Qingshengfaniella alkalisoli TaxID=2599296 RepID=A0A5B8J131_9RHOB|nr:Gfo/Idh/MocA family oxidoreductase [Qingshengfaniella alkalisoli]QDY70891.1 Gfo/Idh/MocA family oxidoreductase [Qingshengfaniella alkalisoli]
MSRIKVGVVGAGVGRSHVEAYNALPDQYEVIAICDLNEERAREAADAQGVENVVTSLEQLFDLGPDIINLCTPSGLHFKQTLQVLDAGFNVVVEKPVGQSLAEVDALIEAEANAKGWVCPIFQYRFGLGVQKLQHLMAKGFAKQASVGTFETHWYRGSAYYDAAAWRGTFDGELGGCLTTHAIHIHDIMCELMGPISSVHARTSRMLNGNETEDIAVLSLAFESGAFATSSVSLGSREQVSRIRLCFDDLVAESGRDPYNPGHDPWAFPNDDANQQARIADALSDFEPQTERFTGQFDRLHHAITNCTALPVTLKDSRRSVELLTAAYYSARTGEQVTLPVTSDHPFYSGWVEILKKDIAHG